MRLLQISDLHIGNLISPPNESERADDLVDAIIKRWGDTDPDEKPVIVITGDIVDSGYKWQYRKAEKILKRLKAKQFEIVFVPGNHDYGPKGNYSGKKFKRYYREYIEDVAYPNTAVQMEHFTIIGLNSMESESGLADRYWANGELGETQLGLLAVELDRLRNQKGSGHIIVVAVHHHPFDIIDTKYPCTCEINWWHCLKDGKKLLDTLSGKVDVLLFGHEHAKDQWPDKYGIPLIVMCDKSTERESLNAYLIELENGGPVARAIDL